MAKFYATSVACSSALTHDLVRSSSLTSEGLSLPRTYRRIRARLPLNTCSRVRQVNFNLHHLPRSTNNTISNLLITISILTSTMRLTPLGLVLQEAICRSTPVPITQATPLTKEALRRRRLPWREDLATVTADLVEVVQSLLALVLSTSVPRHCLCPA
jgi:hypothetical protein